MSVEHDEAIRAAFRQQAIFCEKSGSPMTGDVLNALADTLDHSTRTGSAILDWPGDAMVDALKLRIAGGLHALARSGNDPELSALYQARKGDFAGVFRRVLPQWDDRLFAWLASPPQTNEVGRSAVLWPGLLEMARQFGPDIELLELGSSAGLNLNLDRFGYDLGGARSGDLASPLQLAPEWTGPVPQPTEINIVARAGVDQNPLNVSKPEIAERMLAYVWPDQDDRIARIEAAIALAQRFPPAIEQGDAADWIERRLAIPQAQGVARVVFHSIVLVYLTPEDRARVADALTNAGKSATSERPLAWLSMEFHARTPMAELRLTTWPDGKMRVLAHVHPHGSQINWVAESG
jgi:hypothetical protein